MMENICGSVLLNLAARNNGVQPSTTDVTISKPCSRKNRPKAESGSSGTAHGGVMGADVFGGTGGVLGAVWLCAKGRKVCAVWSPGGVMGGGVVCAVGAAFMLRQSATRCYLLLPRATHCSQCASYEVPPTSCLRATATHCCQSVAEVLPKRNLMGCQSAA